MWRRNETKAQEDYNRALLEDKLLTAVWYRKMSGELPWNPGEREEYDRRFKESSENISACWFASLPEE